MPENAGANVPEIVPPLSPFERAKTWILPPGLSPAIPVLAVMTVVIHLLTAHGYGYFRDELYYLACARRLAWGYVDHPPFSIAALFVNHALLGDSRLALRFLPAVTGGLLVWCTGWLAREVGGGKSAQFLAALAVLVAPYYLAIDHFYSMNAFDLLFWTIAVCLVARLFRDDESAKNARLWLVLGATLGLGLLNKLSVLWLIGGIGLGILLTPHRRMLLAKGPFLALGLAALLFAPHVVWQATHGWPTREFMHNAAAEKMVAVSPLSFIVAQIIDMGPVSALLWIPGLWALLAGKRFVKYRPLGIAYLAILALLLVNQKSRTGYLGPAYPVLFAAGAAAFEPIGARIRGATTAFVTILAASGVAFAPLAMPLLPVEMYIAYARALSQAPSTEENKEVGTLPQFYADMFGWPEMAQSMERAVATLSPEERADAVVLANNYGEAGALEFFGRDLPKVASGHNNYWFWGPGNAQSQTLLLIGNSSTIGAKLGRLCTSAEPRGAIGHPLAMPYENHLTIYLCRARDPLGARWPKAGYFE